MTMPPVLRVLLFVILPIVALVGGTAGAIITMGAMREEPQQAETVPRGLAVFVEQAERSDLTLSVLAQGEARPRREIDIVAQVAGRIETVSDGFIEGGFFEEGDVLVQIERTDYELAVTRARAQVAQGRRTLERERAEAEIAARDWADLGEGEASALTLRQPQLAEAEANLAAAQAALADAELQLRRTAIRAPFDGRVRDKMADIGQYASPGQQQLARIFSTDVMQIRLPLTDDELAELGLPLAFQATADAPGNKVILRADVAGRRSEWLGEVVRTDAAIDPRTRTLAAIVEVADPYGAGADRGAPLAAGLFVDAEILGRQLDDVFVIPRAALRGNDIVYVAQESGELVVRNVTVLSTDRRRAVIAGGLETGDWVITSSVLSASDGMSVEAYDADGALLFPERPEDGDEGDAEAGDSAAAADDDADAVAANEDDAGERS